MKRRMVFLLAMGLMGLLWFPYACSSTPTIDFYIYYAPNNARPDFKTLRFSVFKKHTYPSLKWLIEKHFVNVATPPIELPVFNCDAFEKEKGASPQKPPPEVFVYVEGLSKELEDAKANPNSIDGVIRSGYFSLDKACKNGFASIFLAPPGKISAWSPRGYRENPNITKELLGELQTKQAPPFMAFSRVGAASHINKDGLYWFAGGSQSFSYSEKKGFTSPKNLPVETLAYHHESGLLHKGPSLENPRFFTTMVSQGSRLAVVEGIDMDGNPVGGDYTDTDKTVTDPKQQKGVFSVIVSISKSSYRVLEGFHCPMAQVQKDCANGRVFANTMLLPDKRILVSGGVEYTQASDKDPLVWKGQTQLLLYSPPYTEKASVKVAKPTLLARAGYNILRLGEWRYLLIGGYKYGNGRFGFDGATPVSKVELLSYSTTLKAWKVEQVSFEPPLPPDFGRIFAKSIELSEGKFMISGGVVHMDFDNVKSKPIFAKQAMLIEDSGKTTPSGGPLFSVAYIDQYPRLFHTLQKLPSGQVLILGGANRLSYNVQGKLVELSAEPNKNQIYNPDPFGPFTR